MSDQSIGFAFFRQPILASQSQRLFTKEVRSILENQEQWWLCLGIFKQNWSTIFALMREAHVLKLELGRNQHCRMVEEVRGVSFAFLQALCFGKNRIASLEALQHIKAPFLQWLSFEENNLSDIRSLRRTSFKHLAVLNLKTNRIRELDLRSFHAPVLAKVTLEAYHTDNLQGQSLAWTFTMQTNALQILRCRSERRIVNAPQRLALHQKYPKLNIKRFDPVNMEEQDQSQSDHE